MLKKLKKETKKEFLWLVPLVKMGIFYMVNDRKTMQLKKKFKIGKTRIEYGLVNKEIPNIIYAEIKLRVKPQCTDKWDTFIPIFKKKITHRAKEIINMNEIFSNKFMFDINTFTERMVANKISLFTLDLLLKQKGCNKKEEIKEHIESIIYQIEDYSRTLLNDIGIKVY